jgi:hypothetical protein
MFYNYKNFSKLTKRKQMKNKKSNLWIYTILVMGLILSSTSSCKKDSEKDKPTLAIGQVYAGGIIFYLDDSKLHGYVCAPTDQATDAVWNNGSDVVTNATATGMGDGRTNTDLIVAIQGQGNYAAQICKDLVLNGYDDWYLPSKSECFNMYFNLKIMKKLGNFVDALYWSSTEASIGNAYSQYSNDGYPPNGGYYKNTPHCVRAIRSF